jgi:hypothetical protein
LPREYPTRYPHDMGTLKGGVRTLKTWPIEITRVFVRWQVYSDKARQRLMRPSQSQSLAPDSGAAPPQVQGCLSCCSSLMLQTSSQRGLPDTQTSPQRTPGPTTSSKTGGTSVSSGVAGWVHGWARAVMKRYGPGATATHETAYPFPSVASRAKPQWNPAAAQARHQRKRPPLPPAGPLLAPPQQPIPGSPSPSRAGRHPRARACREARVGAAGGASITPHHAVHA